MSGITWSGHRASWEGVCVSHQLDGEGGDGMFLMSPQRSGVRLGYHI